MLKTITLIPCVLHGVSCATPPLEEKQIIEVPSWIEFEDPSSEGFIVRPPKEHIIIEVSGLEPIVVRPPSPNVNFVAPPAPKISGLQAIEKATEFIKEKVKEVDEIYLSRVALGYHDESNELKWKVVFAKSNAGYYFILVDMNGKATDAPKPKIKEYKSGSPEPKEDKTTPKKNGVPWGRPADWRDVEL